MAQRTSSPRRPSVVVMGAGIAGVNASALLEKSGLVDVTLLEASDRVGGRIHSVEFGGDLIEMGAAWIHGTHGSPIMAVAQEHGLLEGARRPEARGWAGRNCFRREGGADVEPGVVRAASGVFRQLIHEAQSVGAGGAERATYRDATGREAGPEEDVGMYVRRGFLAHLRKGKAAALAEGDCPEEDWDDDWTGASVLAEPGASAVAFQSTVRPRAIAPAARRRRPPSRQRGRRHVSGPVIPLSRRGRGSVGGGRGGSAGRGL